MVVKITTKMTNQNCLRLLHAILLLLLLILQVQSSHSQVSCKQKERRALLELKRGFVDGHGRLSSWGEDDVDCCKWSGIQCNNITGHVEGLNLYDYGEKQPLRGEISSSLMDLHDLTYLDLSGNDFQGKEIPEFFGSLTNLRSLNLSLSSFVGKIPYQLGKLSGLKFLYLRYNNLVGAVPYQLGNLSSLLHLSLDSNNLAGIIPYQLGNLTSLELLYLGNNDDIKFSTSVDWISHLSSLEYLDLSDVSSTVDESKKWLQISLQLPMLKGIIIANCNLTDKVLLSSTYQSNLSTSLSEVDLSSNKCTSSIFTWLFNLSSNLEKIYLEYNLLQGPIPDEFGRIMKPLQHLFLTHNQLNGTIPETFGLLSQLQYLSLGGNYLEDLTNETQFDNLTNLRLLSLSLNSVTVKFSDQWVPPFQLSLLGLKACNVGPTFPNWLQTQKNLKYVDISNAGISDIVGMVSFLCSENSESLSFLNISNNNLEGPIPNCWGHMKLLRVLDLSNNAFSGNVPNSLGSLILIRHLILHNNMLTGELPSLENCAELVFLAIGGNKLSGSIPSWIGSNLRKLEVLSLRKNHFDGSLPKSLCQLQTIQVLDLSQNDLVGEIPNCLKNLSAMTQKRSFMWTMDLLLIYFKNGTIEFGSTYDFSPIVMWKGKERSFKDNRRLLNLIDISMNHLSGKLPAEIGDLVELVSLDLSRNNLSGEIPLQIGNLHSLDFLNLSRNHFSGRIPSSLSEIDRLSVLDLSNNNLSGKIPTGTQLQSFDASSYEGNAYLCGSPLTIICQEDRTNEDPLIRKDNEENNEDFLFTQGFYISMGIGFFTGFWAIFGSLLLFRSWRHAYFNFVYNLMDKIYVIAVVKLRRCGTWLNT